MSIGTPTKQASSPLAVGWVGSRMKVAGAPKRGISLPPNGWLYGGWLNFFVMQRFPSLRQLDQAARRLSESARRKAIATPSASPVQPTSRTAAGRPVLGCEHALPGKRVRHDAV